MRRTATNARRLRSGHVHRHRDGCRDPSVLATADAAARWPPAIAGGAAPRRQERLAESAGVLVVMTHLGLAGAVIGEVSGAITHELNQPLEAILHNAEAGEMMLGAARPADEPRRIFADIRRIDLRAADIIQRLRTLLRRKEFDSQPIPY